MTEPTVEPSTQHVVQTPLSTINQANRLLALLNYDGLFEQIETHPDADVRQRYLAARAIRGQYVEGEVDQWISEFETFKQGVRVGNKDLSQLEVRDEFCRIMKSLDKALTWHSRVFVEDTAAANGPPVTPYFMDEVWRYDLAGCHTTGLAPNGKPKQFYGLHGEEVSSALTTLCDCDNDLFRQLITRKLMVSINRRVVVPMQQRLNKMFRRSYAPGPQGMRGRTLDLIVIALECSIVVTCFASTVVLLRNISSWKYLVLAASLLNGILLFAGFFLSKEFVRLFTLTAAFWAVMVVFMASSAGAPRRS